MSESGPPGQKNFPPPAVPPEGGRETIEGGGMALGGDVKAGEVKALEVAVKEVGVGGAGSALYPSRFSWQRKRQWLRAAYKMWPNVTKICDTVGISTHTYYAHLKQDKIFASKVADVNQRVTDEIEGVLAEEGRKPKGFLDRIAYLRAHRPELYDRAKKVIVEGYRMTGDEAARRLGAVEGAVDAEIVKAYANRKERRQLNAGGGAGSEGGTDKAGGA